MTSGYLTTAANAGFALSGDFTVECWVYSGDSSLDSSTRRRIFHTGGGDIASSLQLLLGTSAGNSAVVSVLNNGWLIDGTINVVTNSWNHVAVTRSGTSLKLFVNGAQSGTTATTSQSFNSGTSNTVYIGANSSGNGIWQGYISNLRVIVGTAIYTAPFTPPTTPFATGTTNQQLLVCYNNNFNDANTATTAKTITVNSTPSVQGFGPFAPALQWTPDVVGGSGYFDGTGDYLTVPSSANLTFGTGDFTFEAWIYPTSWSNARATIARGGGATNSPIFAKFDSSNNLGIAQEGVAWIISDAALPPVNTWTHVAWTRSGTTFKIYVNGVQSGSTGTSSGNFSAPILTVGASDGSTANGFFTGYMTSIRAIKGTAIYTTTFTPPTAPLTAISNTQLLLNATNAGIYDGKMGNNLETVGNAQVSTSPVKYGSGSMKFNGSTDVLTIPNNTNWQSSIANSQGLNFGTGDFTVECWLLFNSTTTYITIVGSRNYSNGGSSTYGNWVLRAGTGQLYASYSNSSTSKVISGTYTWNTGVWYHVAWVRSNGIVNVYQNGISIGSVADTTSLTDGQYGITIGANFDTAGTQGTLYNPFNGYIDDLRITKGVARYFTTFTPPQQALPRQ